MDHGHSNFLLLEDTSEYRKACYNNNRKKTVVSSSVQIQFPIIFNTLTVDYDISHRLHSLLGCRTTSYLVLTLLKIAAAVNVLRYN